MKKHTGNMLDKTTTDRDLTEKLHTYSRSNENQQHTRVMPPKVVTVKWSDIRRWYPPDGATVVCFYLFIFFKGGWVEEILWRVRKMVCFARCKCFLKSNVFLKSFGLHVAFNNEQQFIASYGATLKEMGCTDLQLVISGVCWCNRCTQYVL